MFRRKGWQQGDKDPAKRTLRARNGSNYVDPFTGAIDEGSERDPPCTTEMPVSPRASAPASRLSSRSATKMSFRIQSGRGPMGSFHFSRERCRRYDGRTYDTFQICPDDEKYYGQGPYGANVPSDGRFMIEETMRNEDGEIVPNPAYAPGTRPDEVSWWCRSVGGQYYRTFYQLLASQWSRKESGCWMASAPARWPSIRTSRGSRHPSDEP